MKRLSLLLASLLTTSIVFGRQAMTPAPLNVRTVDGTTSNFPYQLKVPNSSLTDNADGTMTFSAIISTNVLQSGTTIFASSETVTTFYASTATITNLIGTTTNNNAAVGNVGEFTTAISTGAINILQQDVLTNVSTVTLTTGDWMVAGTVRLSGNGATFTGIGYIIGAISAFSANTNTDGVADYTNIYEQIPAGVSPTIAATASIPPVRFSLSTTTAIYIKLSQHDTVSVATPQASGSLQAWRVR